VLSPRPCLVGATPAGPARAARLAVACVLVGALAPGCSFQPAPPTGPGDGADGRVDAGAGGDGRPDAERADAGVDAAPPCPPTYAQVGVASPGSRYRVLSVTASFRAQHDACLADRPGSTHLVVLETDAEAAEVGGLVGGGEEFYVGAVQRSSGGGVGDGWVWLTGAAVAVAWSAGQPNDEAGVENGDQDVASAYPVDGSLNDVSGDWSYRAACECDGLALDPAAIAAIP
jgi:hypothetical protein